MLSNPTHKRPSSVWRFAPRATAAPIIKMTFTTSSTRWPPANLSAVSFLKAPAFRDGHAGYSDPLLEQPFLVNTVNAIGDRGSGGQRPLSSCTTTQTGGTLEDGPDH